MRKFAFFLPQFHEIPENNEWWGKGFTEWVNVKKATPLFNRHEQPVVPLNNNYYNLLNKEVVEWQTKLMKDYKVDGLIYYHYYFDGKLLLEKPAENLLKWKEINQPFFFCWANHSWIKSWEGSSKILISQEYGNENSWEKHFQYLLPFFKDQRYEKKNNCPLFMVFKSDIPCKRQMFDYFDRRCKDSGFNGICLIETYQGEYWEEDYKRFFADTSKQTQYIHFREPSCSMVIYEARTRNSVKHVVRGIQKRLAAHSIIKQPYIYNGDQLFECMMKYEPYDKKIVHGLFFGWDNTPRHGRRGYLISKVSHEQCERYMQQVKNEEYLFINAWNEWCEGMILEPTTREGYRNLEWIRDLSL